MSTYVKVMIGSGRSVKDASSAVSDLVKGFEAGYPILAGDPSIKCRNLSKI